MSRSCRVRRSRPVPTIAPFVDSVEEALFVIDASVTSRPFGLVVLILTADRRVVTAVQIEGGDTTERRWAACDALLSAAGPDSVWGAAVLASDRHGAGVDAAEGDVVQWAVLRDRFAAGGVELVDWLLVDDDLARSMAESFGRGWEG